MDQVAFASKTFRPARPVDLFLTLAPLQRAGREDPCIRVEPDAVWRATRTPEGLATERLTSNVGGVTVEAWGPGAGWAVEHAPVLLGARDDDNDFVPLHPVVAELHRRLRGLRLVRTESVFEAVVPTILEQKVAGVEARWAYRRVLETLGEPAPGPGGLRVPPSPEVLVATPYWVFHRFGVERRRAETIQRAALHARRLEEVLLMEPAEARRRLMAVPGMGAWTAAEVAQVALGDADAVSVGDYHQPHLVSWALAREPRGSDARMLELLEPYRGHRARVVRLLLTGGLSAPRFGPHLPLRRIARY